MKKPALLALILSLLSSLGHLYLSQRTYALQAGSAGPSAICSVSEAIQCDPALLSPYAKIFGLSISNFGFSLNFLLAGLILALLFFGAGPVWRGFSLYLSSALALGSVFMGAVALLDRLFCPVCFALYALSFACAGLLFWAFRKNWPSPLSFIRQNFKNKAFYIVAGLALFAGFFVHISFVTAFDLKGQKPQLQAVMADWRSEQRRDMPSNPLMKKGDPAPLMLIVEFADFLCPACERVRPALDSFLKSFPKTAFHFYLYPLDGACNPAIKFKSSNASCEIAKAFVCSARQGQGEKAYQFIFQNQNRLLREGGDKTKLKAFQNEMIEGLSVAKEPFESCLQDPSTQEAIKASAEAGERLRIRGTPAFFVNGKRLSGHSPRLLILREIWQYLQNRPKKD